MEQNFKIGAFKFEPCSWNRIHIVDTTTTAQPVTSLLDDTTEIGECAVAANCKSYVCLVLRQEKALRYSAFSVCVHVRLCVPIQWRKRTFVDISPPDTLDRKKSCGSAVLFVLTI